VLLRNLFDGVAENLLQNALAKRQRQAGLSITVRFSDAGLSVADDGNPLGADVLATLFRQQGNSEYGLGIGLYHAACLAKAAGYQLSLLENYPGRVVFSLSVRR